MRRVGRNPDALLMRRPLRLASLDGRFRLSAPRLPAPLHLAVAVLGARGLSWSDRLGMLRLMRGLKAMSWAPPREWTVLQLLRHYAQSDTLIRQLWDPLCLAALNTPTAQASAGLYARVLRTAWAAGAKPATCCCPAPTCRRCGRTPPRHLTMRYGSTVRQLQPSQDGVVVNQERFDAAVLAVPPAFAARLLDAPLREAGAGGLLDALKSFDYLPIATLNLRLAGPGACPNP